MPAREILARCLAALVLLTPSFAQNRHSSPPPRGAAHAQPHPQAHRPQPQHPPSRPAQHADGQWHSFQKEGGGNPGRPNEARAPQNQPGHAGNWLRNYKNM